jgi:hypothetical protein
MFYYIKISQDQRSTGATLIEFAFASMVFFVIVLGFFDLARYIAVLGMLNKSALNGLVIAQAYQGMDIDLRQLEICSGNHNNNCLEQDTEKYNQYKRAHELASNYAKSYATSALTSSSENLNAPAALKSFTTVLPHRFNLIAPIASDVLILRPGEHGYFDESNGERKDIVHPTLCPADTSIACPDGVPRISANDSYSMLLREHPLYVELRTSFNPILPMLPRLVAVGRAVGFREPSPSGSNPSLAAIGGSNLLPQRCCTVPCTGTIPPPDCRCFCGGGGTAPEDNTPTQACCDLASRPACPDENGMQCISTGGGSCRWICGRSGG